MLADSSSSHDAAPSLDHETLRRELSALRLGTPLLYFAELDSTNSHATELARNGAAEGTLVLADFQSAGRGRIGRAWKGLPAQQLALSLVLRPRFPAHFLMMASALAVAEAVEVVTGLQPRSYRDAREHGAVAAPAQSGAAPVNEIGIKWPNDVQVGGRKVSGILIETSDDFAVLGIGINVNGTLAGDAELAARAMTLEQAMGFPLSREALLVALLRRLDALYGELQAGGESARGALRQQWGARLVTLGTRVTVQQAGRELVGRAEDVNEDGALLVRDGDGVQRLVTWGDVHSAG